MLTIENGREEPHSLLSPTDDDRSRPWPHFNVRRFEEVMEPSTAVKIISMVYGGFEDGKETGRNEALHNVRKAIGL